jgi:N-acetyl-1-D-myo-inositol-2-amino-2-deoxy-alpha-D-glucopyranoside deacetylase
MSAGMNPGTSPGEQVGMNLGMDPGIHAALRDFEGYTLLAVFAHPDDESLASGGLLAWCAERGARVSLLCLSRGERGQRESRESPESSQATEARETGDPLEGARALEAAGAAQGALAATRAHELADAARVLGIDDVTLLGHADGMLPWLAPGVLEADVRAAIERLHPQVVVTFGEDGLYWHPDHIATHDATRAAVAAMETAAPALYYVTTPPGQMRAVVDAATARVADPSARRDILGIDAIDAFGSCAQPPTLVVDTGQRARRKLAALRCHRTQVAGGPLERIDEADAAALLGVEHYRRAEVGSTADAFIERLGAPREVARP